MDRRSLPLLVTLLLLGGCVSNSQPRLAREADRLVKPGMARDAAVAALKGHGFACEPRRRGPGDNGDLVCSRDRAWGLLAGCVQRVVLTMDAPRAKVALVEALKPACAGL